jgi:hypothetical protein
VRDTSGNAAAIAWRKAMRKAMQGSRGELTTAERKLIKQARASITTTTTTKEGTGASAVLRRAAKK